MVDPTSFLYLFFMLLNAHSLHLLSIGANASKWKLSEKDGERRVLHRYIYVDVIICNFSVLASSNLNWKSTKLADSNSSYTESKS